MWPVARHTHQSEPARYPRAVQSDSLIGHVVDSRYTITGRVGRGGMATVYRAHDTRLDRDVALKVMHPHLAEQPGFVERFKREARTAAQLTSAYVVAVHDQGVWESPIGPQAYLIMELVPGPDVRSELTRLGSFNLGTALEIVEQTLRALGAAHQAGLVHRDVKPENVMLTAPLPPVSVFDRPEIHAKVADFGLARVATSTTTASTAMGTIAYVAPEVVTNSKAGAASDVYSVGIMLYEFLTGKLPFQAPTPIATAYQHINTPMPRVADQADWLPPAVDSLIALLTAKDPLMRPSDGNAALTELQAITAAIPEEDLLRRIPVVPTVAAGTIDSTRKIDDDATPATSGTKVAAYPPQRTNVMEDAPAASPTKKRQKKQKTDSLLPSRAPHHGQSDVSPKPRKKKRPIVPLIITLVFLLVVGLAAGWYFLLGPGKRSAVPDVVGMSYEQASSTLKEHGFVDKKSEAYSDTVDNGYVISTNPEADMKVNPADPIDVLVSLGIEQVQVPALDGKDKAAVEEALTTARLTLVSQEEYSDDIAEGLVISQSITAGQSVDHDSKITVVFSKGPAPITVPNVVGKTQEEATATIEGLNLAVSVNEEFSNDIEKGLVISQAPTDAEGPLHRGDTVTLTVSKGPEMLPVPNVVGLSKDEATKKLESAGFAVQSENLLWGVFNSVYSQNPAGGQLAPRGSTITISMV